MVYNRTQLHFLINNKYIIVHNIIEQEWFNRTQLHFNTIETYSTVHNVFLLFLSSSFFLSFVFFFAMQITTQSYLLPFSFVCTYSYGRVVRVRQKISYHIDSHLLNTNFPFVFFFQQFVCFIFLTVVQR
uniref:Uncharacterized protein n=1 Tax=Cacopsylla melanoneura TaxID=428564 RepID=A0A8D8R715_9HEMI